MSLIYDIADEYLPDVTILGVDGPNTGLAGDIVDKVLDAAVHAATARLEGISEAQGDKRDRMSMIVAGNEMNTSINALKVSK